jgi:ankyrin repeat protein
MDYKSKYIKYKQKYIQLKNQFGGSFNDFLDAIKANNYSKVKTMIDDNYVNQKDKNNKTPLMFASEKGYSDIVMLLLSKANNEYKISLLNLCNIRIEFLKSTVTNIDVKDNSGINALMYACKNGHLEVIKLLLFKGANINDKDKYNEKNSLMYASQYDRLEVVKLLLSKGASIGNGSNKKTALMYASQFGKIEIVKLLLAKGADINSIDKSDNKNALIYAFQFNNINIVKLLLSSGVNIKDSSGLNYLIYSSKNDYNDVVKLLLSIGSDLNDKDDNGLSALMYASKNGNKSIVKLLLDKGVNINVKNNNDRNALMYACQNGHLEVVKLLLNKDTINDKDINGVSSLMYACQNNHVSIIKFLLDNGANMMDSDDNNVSVLMYASKYGNESIVNSLLDSGVDVNAVDIYGWNSLMYASWKNHHEIVKLLILKNANVNDVDNYLTSSLMIASQNNNFQIVNSLLDIHVMIDAKDIYGWDYLMCACWNKHSMIISQNDCKDINNNFNYDGKIGLANVGNTCWLNSLIQCLIHIDIFVEIFLGNKFKNDLKNDLDNKGIVNFINEFVKIIKLIYDPSFNKKNTNLNSKNMNIFKQAFIKLELNWEEIEEYVKIEEPIDITGNIIKKRQCDANEGYAKIFQALSEGLNKVKDIKGKYDVTNTSIYKGNVMKVNIDGSNMSTIANLYLERFNEYTANSLVDDLFCFVTKQSYICKEDGEQNDTVTFEYKNQIELAVEYNLLDSLNEYIKCEDMRNQNIENTCTICNKNYIIKKNIFWSCPKILCIQLKRFIFVNGIGIKIQTYMDFSFELDLYNYVGDPNKQSNDYKYELCSVCYHIGSTLNTGHYISICKCNDGWYKFDDSTVTRVNIKEIFNNEAYLLFYKRV